MLNEKPSYLVSMEKSISKDALRVGKSNEKERAGTRLLEGEVMVIIIDGNSEIGAHV